MGNLGLLMLSCLIYKKLFFYDSGYKNIDKSGKKQ
jgi:hypothetical protein